MPQDEQVPLEQEETDVELVPASSHYQWKILAFGQALSLLMACTGAAQSTLALECNLSAPTFTLGVMYLGLSANLIQHWRTSTTIPALTGGETLAPAPHRLVGIPLQAPWYLYLCIACLDVYANYFLTLAFKYTTITSVTLFDALAIPSSMALSRLFLQRRYSYVHLCGVAACTIGIVCNVWEDWKEDQQQNDLYPLKPRGDLLAITGGLLLGASTVVGEATVKSIGGPNEYLGMLGLWGSVICAIQTILLETDEVAAFFGEGKNRETCSKVAGWWLLLGYLISSVLAYNGSIRFLHISEAALFNLSLLTGDLWSVIFSVFAEKIVPRPLFFVALVFILSGVFIYEMAPTPVQEVREKYDHQESWQQVSTEVELTENDNLRRRTPSETSEAELA